MKRFYVFIAGLLTISMLIPVVGLGCAPKEKGPIKIGYIASISGPVAEKTAHMTRGIQLAVKEINDEGGILGGRQIELLLYDDKLDPAEGVSVANRAIYADKVHAVVGMTDMGIAAAVLPVVKKAGIPFVNTMSNGPWVNEPGEAGILNMQADFGPIAASNALLMKTIVEKIIERPISTAVCVGPETPFLYSNYDAMRAIFGQPGGSETKILDYIAYPIGSPDVTTPVSKGLGYNPDLFWSWDWGIVGAAQIFKTLAEFNYQGVKFQEFGSQDMVDMAGGAMEGAFTDQAWSPEIDVPESKAFIQRYYEMFGSGTPMSDVSMMGYSGVMMLCKAMDKAGTVSDLVAIQNAYNQLDWVSPAGAVAKVAADGRFEWPYRYILQVVNGKLVEAGHVKFVLGSQSN